MFSKIVAFIAIVNSIGFSHGVSEGDKHGLVSGGLIDYLMLGAKHMVTGYDHILFLVGVVFFLTKFRDIAKFVTTFTIGHSITLVLATYFEIKANYFLIDAVIAISVIYKGFENLGGFQKYLKMNSPNLIGMVFVFGLIHGFGLSTRLQEMPLGHHNLISKILSFNVGVEIGQILALIPILILVNVLRKKESIFKPFSIIVNSLLVIIGVALLVFQLKGYVDSRNESEANNSNTSAIEEKLDLGDNIDTVQTDTIKLGQDEKTPTSEHDESHDHNHEGHDHNHEGHDHNH